MQVIARLISLCKANIFSESDRVKFLFGGSADNKWIYQNIGVEGHNSSELDFRINSFGEDQVGEIYVLTQNELDATSQTDTVYRITLSDKQASAMRYNTSYNL